MASLHKGFYYNARQASAYYNTISIGVDGNLAQFIDATGKIGFGTGRQELTAQVTVSGTTEIPPLRLIGLSQSQDANFLIVDVDGNVKYRNDIVTGVTVTNNVITTTNSTGGTTTFTVDAITGGTFSNDTIVVQGSGTITNITGIKTFYGTDGTLSGNRVVNTQTYSMTYSGSNANMFKIVYTGNTSTDKVLQTANGSGTNFYVTANGDLSATSKSFLIPNKLKPGYMLRHGSLEGPEHGVYHRGKLNGSGIIELPDYWEWLVDEDTITVQLTPIVEFKQYLIKSISNTQVEISNLEGTDNVNCFYIIHGERKDIDKMIVDEKINT
jgi:hypothetical protein